MVVTYSSISTNGFENYGECVMGDRGTMIVEKEPTVMLYPEDQPGKVKTQPRGHGSRRQRRRQGQAGVGVRFDVGRTVGSRDRHRNRPRPTISRGYREEMEDFAYCVRLWDPKQGYEKDKDGNYEQRLPRCHGEVAMADAIIALTANHAMHTHQRIEFKDAWFHADKDDVPPGEQKAKVEIA